MLPLLQSPSLRARDGVVHGFTTREGGVSTGALASLNLALRPAEQPAALAENWARVAAALVPEWGADRVALLSQVHGPEVVRVHAGAGPLTTLAEADASWTTEPGVILAIRVADCAPILVASPNGIAAIHAGWRGVASWIIGRAIRALADGTGDDPSTMIASVGPCISAERYEVGPEVIDAMTAAGLDPWDIARPGPRGRPHLDLRRAVEAQLRDFGVGVVEGVDRCTAGDPRLWSHRRDGEAGGRIAGVIARIPA